MRPRRFTPSLMAGGLTLALLFAFAATASRAATLSVDGSRFRIDGKSTFLLGVSYYAGTGAPKEFVKRDFQALKRRGFNWVRVWATWNAFGHDVSAVDSGGQARQPYLRNLLSLVKEANRHGIIVDVTLSRGEPVFESTTISNQAVHLKAVETLAKALKPHRNVYMDLANERNISDARFTSFEDLRALRERIRKVDPKRLVTASSGGDIPEDEVITYILTVGVDFLTPHRPRGKGPIEETEGRTQEYLRWMSALGKVVPVHYQEPFRRGYPFDGEGPSAEDFLRDAAAARRGGAAGWCLHNGGTRTAEDGRPRRSFDLRQGEGRPFDQLDSVERDAVERLSGAVASAARPTR